MAVTLVPTSNSRGWNKVVITPRKAVVIAFVFRLEIVCISQTSTVDKLQTLGLFGVEIPSIKANV